jgi:short-subunit dehydrogenase
MSPPEGRTIVITGAAGGIGAPLSRLFVQAGANVIGIDRVACAEASQTVLADLSDDAVLAQLADRLAADPPDVLVNLAGVMAFGLLEDQTIAALALCYRINLLVPTVLARAVAAPMRARGSGQIVNVGSVLGAIPFPWFAAYSSSKAGLAALSQALRRELAGSGVSVTHVSPRAARTAFNSAEVERFLAVTGMAADDPEWVATRIFNAIVAQRQHVTIGAMERVYGVINALAPGIIDAGLAGQVARARKLLA